MNLQKLNKVRGQAIFCGLLNCCLTLYVGYTSGFDSWPFRFIFGCTVIISLGLLVAIYLERRWLGKDEKKR